MPARSSRLRGVRVLLVEDDDDLREVLAETLGDAGMVVSQAHDGDEGWERFQAARPDVVLSDIWMVPADGFSLIRRIRALDVGEGGLTPAIAMTAGAKHEASLEAGFHACFFKPLDVATLLRAVEDFVRDDGRVAARWTWTTGAQPDQLVLTLSGEATPADTRAYCAALLAHLQAAGGPVDLTVDLAGLEGFSLAVPSATERALWPVRDRIRQARVIGASRLVALLARLTCRVLGIPCTIEERRG